MKQLMKIELGKAFRNKWFVFAVAIGIACAAVTLYQVLSYYYGENGAVSYYSNCMERGTLPKLSMEEATLYNSWMGANMGAGVTVFFYLIPLLAVLPCGMNVSDEINGGYLKLVLPRVGKRRYFGSKLLASFLAGGSAVAVPLLVSLLATAAFIPAVMPRTYNTMYYWVGHGDLFSSLAYSHPLVYACIYILIDFIFGGLFACLSLVVALQSEVRVAALVVPYIFVILCDAARNFLNYICYIEISPLNLMHSLPPSNASKWYVYAAWLVIFSGIILLGGLWEGVRKEYV